MGMWYSKNNSLTQDHLGWLHILAIVNWDAINIGAFIYWFNYIWPVGCEKASSYRRTILRNLRNLHTIFRDGCTAYIPINNALGSFILISTPAFIIFDFWTVAIPIDEVKFHCSSDLHFPDFSYHEPFKKNLSVGHLHLMLWKVPIFVLVLFLNWIVLLLLGLLSFL